MPSWKVSSSDVWMDVWSPMRFLWFCIFLNTTHQLVSWLSFLSPCLSFGSISLLWSLWISWFLKHWVLSFLHHDVCFRFLVWLAAYSESCLSSNFLPATWLWLMSCFYLQGQDVLLLWAVCTALGPWYCLGSSPLTFISCMFWLAHDLQDLVPHSLA